MTRNGYSIGAIDGSLCDRASRMPPTLVPTPRSRWSDAGPASIAPRGWP